MPDLVMLQKMLDDLILVAKSKKNCKVGPMLKDVAFIAERVTEHITLYSHMLDPEKVKTTREIIMIDDETGAAYMGRGDNAFEATGDLLKKLPSALVTTVPEDELPHEITEEEYLIVKSYFERAQNGRINAGSVVEDFTPRSGKSGAN